MQNQENRLMRAPGWLFSIGIHLAIALAATFFCLDRFVTEDAWDEARVNLRTEETKIAELDRADQAFKRSALPGEAPESSCDESPDLFSERSGGVGPDRCAEELNGDGEGSPAPNREGGVRGIRRGGCSDGKIRVVLGHASN